MLPRSAKNQKELLNVAVKCFVTAKRDNPKNKRCNTTYSFGLMLESLSRKYEMISKEIVQQYLDEIRDDDKKMEKLNEMEKDVLKQISRFIMMAEEDESESESESD